MNFVSFVCTVAWQVLFSVLVSIVLVTFLVQCFMHKRSRTQKKRNTFTILTTIGLVTIGLNFTLCWMFSVVTITDSDSLWNIAAEMSGYLQVLHLAFFIARLYLTFRDTTLSVSPVLLILYILLALACFTLSYLSDLTMTRSMSYADTLYYISESLRLIAILCISIHFTINLFKLIMSNYKMYYRKYNRYDGSEFDSGKLQSRMMGQYKLLAPDHGYGDGRGRLTPSSSVYNFESINGKNNNNNKQSIKLSSSSFDRSINIAKKSTNIHGAKQGLLSRQHVKFLNIVSKLTFLATIDCVLLIFWQFWLLIELDNIGDFISWIYYLSIVLVIWLSFTFADKQYICLFGKCHDGLFRLYFRFAVYKIGKIVRASIAQTENVNENKSIQLQTKETTYT